MQLLVLDEANHHIDNSFPDMLVNLLLTLNPMHLQALAIVMVAHSDGEDNILERKLAAAAPVDVLTITPPETISDNSADVHQISADAYQAGRNTAMYLQQLEYTSVRGIAIGKENVIKPYVLTHSKISAV